MRLNHWFSAYSLDLVHRPGIQFFPLDTREVTVKKLTPEATGDELPRFLRD